MGELVGDVTTVVVPQMGELVGTATHIVGRQLREVCLAERR